MTLYDLKPPYLIFLGEETREAAVKTGLGLVEWRRPLCAGQVRLSPDTYDLGLPDMTLEAAKAAGVKSMVIGTAQVGGALSETWQAEMLAALSLGFDIVSGLHVRLNAIPELKAAAEANGARIHDIRRPPDTIPVGTGLKRSGRRLLTVGTDCVVGKKYTALQLEKDMRSAGWKADFRATGQTGIMIAGGGFPIDAVISDFVSGAAELLSPAQDADHWDIIEGQGGLFHPGYAAVTLGLLHGSQPDAFVVCHHATRETLYGWPTYPIPSIGSVIEGITAMGRVTNPDIRCVGISVNTSMLTDHDRTAYLARLSDMHGLPCVDPLVEGTGAIIDTLPASKATE